MLSNAPSSFVIMPVLIQILTNFTSSIALADTRPRNGLTVRPALEKIRTGSSDIAGIVKNSRAIRERRE